jgi:hypothetical protein
LKGELDAIRREGEEIENDYLLLRDLAKRERSNEKKNKISNSRKFGIASSFLSRRFLDMPRTC